MWLSYRQYPALEYSLYISTIVTGVAVIELVNKKTNNMFPDTYLRYDLNHILMGYANKREPLQSLFATLKDVLSNAFVRERQMAMLIFEEEDTLQKTIQESR